MSQLKGLKLATPTYQIVLPSSGEALTMYPFKVQDEKNLLIASETGDQKNMIGAVKSIIENNVKGLSKPVSELSSYEVEWLFLQLRAKSVGEISKITLQCGECQHENNINVNIEEISFDVPEKRENIVKITDDFAVEMRDPFIDDVVDAFGNDENTVEQAVKMMASCVKTVFNGDETITVTPAEIEDLVDIFNNLTNDQFQKVQTYFESMPKLQKDISYKCSGCGNESNQTLEGFQSFF